MDKKQIALASLSIVFCLIMINFGQYVVSTGKNYDLICVLLVFVSTLIFAKLQGTFQNHSKRNNKK